MDSVFLQHKQSILVISSKKIYAYEDELVISSDSATQWRHSRKTREKKAKLPFDLDFIKFAMYLAGFICVQHTR